MKNVILKDIISIIFILGFGLNLFIISDSQISKQKQEQIQEQTQEQTEIILKNKDKNIEPIIDTTDYSLRYQLKNRDRSVVEDTLVAPEKRVERHQYTSLKLYENTRGDPDDYQLLGVLFNNTVNKTYQLFGRRTYPGSPLFEYYYRGRDSGGLDFKFPLSRNEEIYDGDSIILPTDNIQFEVKIYPNDLPRYNPFVL
tara:strand:+ start:115 stop:708 length:594 start_codon:yes stop_codon:yes gene_type:complete